MTDVAGNSNATPANITVTVNAVADIVDDAVSTNEDTAVTFNPVLGTNEVSGADNFEGSAQITAINGTAITAGGAAVAVSHGSVTLGAGNALTFTPDADYNGPATFSYTASNGGPAETANITVTVNAVADIVDDAVSTNEDTAVTFNPVLGTNEVSGADNFEGSAQITAINGTAITAGGAAVAVSHGSVTLGAGNALTFTPDADYNGPATFAHGLQRRAGRDRQHHRHGQCGCRHRRRCGSSTNEDTAVTFNPVLGTN